MNEEKQKIIRAGGIVAIIGGIINIVSDQLLYHGPVSGSELNLLYMGTNIPYNQTLIGTIMGAALGIPLWLGILIPLYYALKPAGKWFCIPSVLLFAHVIVISAVFHGAASLSSAGYYVFANAGAESKIIVSEMIDKYMAFEKSLGFSAAFSLFLSSIWIMIAVFTKPTLYKRWMVLFTPIFSVLVGLLIINQIPAPIGGYIAPMDGSTIFTIFFILTTKVTWNYKETYASQIN